MTDRGPEDRYLGIAMRRESILDRLAMAPAGPQALADDIGCSRSTVDRGIRELKAVGLVEDDPTGHRLTLLGRLVHEEYTTLARGMDGIGAAEDLLGPIPAAAPMDPSVISSGTVTRGAEARSRAASLVAPADRLSVVLGRAATGLAEFVRWLDPGASLRAVIPTAATRRLATSGGPYRAHPVELTLRETDDPLPFTLALARTNGQETLAVCGHESGELSWLVDAREAEPLRWGRQLIDAHWSDGTPLPSPR